MNDYGRNTVSLMMDRRATLSPYRIGHQLFWLLRSEMHNPDVSERFGILLFMYLNHCGPHRVYIRRQVVVNDKIRVIAEQIKTIPNKARRVAYAREELAKLRPHLPSRFQLYVCVRIYIYILMSTELCAAASAEYDSLIMVAASDFVVCQVFVSAHRM